MTIKLKEPIKLTGGDVLSTKKSLEAEKRGKYFFVKAKTGLTVVIHQKLVATVE